MERAHSWIDRPGKWVDCSIGGWEIIPTTFLCTVRTSKCVDSFVLRLQLADEQYGSMPRCVCGHLCNG